MRFLIMTDIEGVTGITTFEQAERSELGRRMLMHDLLAVIQGIRAAGDHEIVVYDMHTDGCNIDIEQLPADICVVEGKPIDGKCYRGGGAFDGLFLVGLHAMQHANHALLQHSYLREYDAIHIDGTLVGEIGVEAALAGEQGTPLLFVSSDNVGCAEALALIPKVQTAVVKHSLGETQAICYPPARTGKVLAEAAERAARLAHDIPPFVILPPYTVEIQYSACRYLDVMRGQKPEWFVDDNTVRFGGENLLECWSAYLDQERKMTSA